MSGFDEHSTLYMVQQPSTAVWTDNYELAYEEATGMQLAEGEDDLEAETRITAFGVDRRTVACVYCDAEISYSLIGQHHTNEHPFKRWNPAYYPEVGQ